MNWYGHKKLDKFLYEKYFLDKKDGFAIEAGALDGINYSNCKTLEEIGWKCVNIEPNPIEFAKLVINRPNAINLNVGLFDKNGTSLFEVRGKAKTGRLTNESGINVNLRTPGPDPGRRYGTYKFEVKTITYKNLIEDLKIEKVDLFVLDVEGWETQVIGGMKGCDVLPKVFCVENLLAISNPTYYEKLIETTFENRYRKDSRCWLNDIYVRRI
jgi:FkbM family methyltransferase